jgi:hypothetical protein
MTYPRTAEHFITNWTCADGLEGICKKCRNERVKNYKRSNSSRISAERRRQYSDDKGAIHKAREVERHKRDPYLYRAQVICSGMRERAARLGLPFDQTIFAIQYMAERLRRSPRCECCGHDLDIRFRESGPRRFINRTATADRIIPAKGYTRGNVAILCWRCNNLKRDARPEELEVVAAWMRLKENSEGVRQFGTSVIQAALGEAA